MPPSKIVDLSSRRNPPRRETSPSSKSSAGEPLVELYVHLARQEEVRVGSDNKDKTLYHVMIWDISISHVTLVVFGFASDIKNLYKSLKRATGNRARLVNETIEPDTTFISE